MVIFISSILLLIFILFSYHKIKSYRFKSINQHWICSSCQTENTAVENGADVNAKEDYQGFTPLLKAIYADQRSLVIILIAYGADLKVKSNKNRSSMQEAEFCQDPALTAILQKAETPEIQALVKAVEKDKVIEILTQVEKEIKEAEKKAKEEAWKIKFENAQKKHQSESLNIQK